MRGRTPAWCRVRRSHASGKAGCCTRPRTQGRRSMAARGHAVVVEDARLAQVSGKACVPLYRARHEVQGGACLGWVGQEDVEIVEKDHELLTLPQLRVCPAQRLVLAQGEKGWGQGSPCSHPPAWRMPWRTPKSGHKRGARRARVRVQPRAACSGTRHGKCSRRHCARPATDTTVAWASFSRVARSRAVSAPTPARVRSANWYGLVAWSKTGAHVAASERETSRRNISPVAIPRTPPPGLRVAVIRVNATPSAMSQGTSACASALAASASNSMSSVWPNNSLHCNAEHARRTARVHSHAWLRGGYGRPRWT